MQRDYDILKLKPGASWLEVKQAYKKRVLEWHPDRFPADDAKKQKRATQMFTEITAAYTRLEARHTRNEQGKFADEQPEYENVSSGGGPSGSAWQDTATQNLPQFMTRTWDNGDKYEGMVLNEMMHGQGIFTYRDGSVYSGQFRFGKMEGQGTLVYPNGDKYSGGFRENRFHGQGKMNFANGDRYMGGFVNDQYHGQGVFVSEGKVYAGQWEYGSLSVEEPPRGF